MKILLFFLLAFFSCRQQLPQEHNIESKKGNYDALDENIITRNSSPRTDSILQFSLMITDIFEDSKGNFWFGTHGDGLCRYDGIEYTYFTVGTGLVSGIFREFAPGPDWSKTRRINGGNQIESIQEDSNGNILIKSKSSICKFNGKEFVPVKLDGRKKLSINRTDEEWEKDLESLWFGQTDELGVYRYDGVKLEFLSFPELYDFNRDGVSELYKDKVGNIWFGTMENGTYRYDGKSFVQISLENEIGICRSVFQDDSGKTWITNNRFDLLYLEGDSLVNFIEKYSSEKQDKRIAKEFSSGFQSIAQSENGDLWFGSFGSGLWRYNGTDLKHFSEDGALPIVTVKSIYKDKHGKLWFGIGEGSVYGYHGESFYRFDGMEIK